MYVGHALLAFALTAAPAWALGWHRRRVIAVGTAAAAFAIVPDVDAAHTIMVALQRGPPTVFPTTEYVWTVEGWYVHRSLTHSLIVGTATALLAAVVALAHRESGLPRVGFTILGGTLVVSLIALGLATDGLLGGSTMALYGAGALCATALAVWRVGVPSQVGAAAAVGLLTHPFGDVFMGRPPAFLYPLVTEPTVETVTLAGDPTVNLLLLFALEIALAWAVLLIVVRTRATTLRQQVAWPATFGFGFAAAVLVIRPPTLDVAYHFAIGTLATGAILGGAPVVIGRPGQHRRLRFVATGLAAVTVAVVGYLAAYLLYAP